MQVQFHGIHSPGLLVRSSHLSLSKTQLLIPPSFRKKSIFKLEIISLSLEPVPLKISLCLCERFLSLFSFVLLFEIKRSQSRMWLNCFLDLLISSLFQLPCCIQLFKQLFEQRIRFVLRLAQNCITVSPKYCKNLQRIILLGYLHSLGNLFPFLNQFFCQILLNSLNSLQNGVVSQYHFWGTCPKIAPIFLLLRSSPI